MRELAEMLANVLPYSDLTKTVFEARQSRGAIREGDND